MVLRLTLIITGDTLQNQIDCRDAKHRVAHQNKGLILSESHAILSNLDCWSNQSVLMRP